MKIDPTMYMKTKASMTKCRAKNQCLCARIRQLCNYRQQSVGLIARRCTNYAIIRRKAEGFWVSMADEPSEHAHATSFVPSPESRIPSPEDARPWRWVICGLSSSGLGQCVYHPRPNVPGGRNGCNPPRDSRSSLSLFRPRRTNSSPLPVVEDLGQGARRARGQGPGYCAVPGQTRSECRPTR